jgi:hypothetical protein
MLAVNIERIGHPPNADLSLLYVNAPLTNIQGKSPFMHGYFPWLPHFHGFFFMNVLLSC